MEKKKARHKEEGEPFTEGPKPNSEVRQKFHEEEKEAPMVLRYVPASKRKEGQSPFGLTMETKDKCKNSIQEKDIAILKNDFTLPLPKLDQVASTKPPFKGFIKATRNLVEEDSLPVRRTEEGFDPKAYKLLANSGYDFQNPPQLGQLYSDYVEEKSRRLNSTQSKLKQQGYAIKIPRIGLGHSSQEPVRISAKGKGKR